MSQSGTARTQRLDPSLMALMTISPPSISTSAWTGWPASKIRAAPCIRLVRPEMMAASCSAKTSGISIDKASGTPSAETTAAYATSATRAVNLLTSQFRSSRYT